MCADGNHINEGERNSFVASIHHQFQQQQTKIKMTK